MEGYKEVKSTYEISSPSAALAYNVVAPVRPPKKASPGSSGGTSSKLSRKVWSSGSVFFLLGKVAPPFFNHCVASISEDCGLQTCGFIDLFDGSVWMAVSFLLTAEGETSFTTMKNASLILVHCIAVCMITIHIVGRSWG